MTKPLRWAALYLSTLLLTLVALVPSAGGSPAAPSAMIGKTVSTPTSVVVHWTTPNTPASSQITGYVLEMVGTKFRSPTYSANVRVGTIAGLATRSAYRVELLLELKSGANFATTRVVYTTLSSGKAPAPLGYPIIAKLTATDTSISVSWTPVGTARSVRVANCSIYVVATTAPILSQGITLLEPANASSGTVTGLIPGTSYAVQVRAQDGAGTQVVTKAAIDTTGTPPTT